MSTSTPQPGLLHQIVTLPIRAYRERISLQLIASNVLVVLLTVLLVEFALIVLLLFLVGLPLGPNVVNEQIGWQSEQAAQALTMTEAGRSLADGELTAGERAELTSALEQYISEGVPLFPYDDGVIAPLGGNPHALITDASGRIIVSTEPGWAPPGDQYEQIAFGPAVNVVGRAIELSGGRTGYGNTYVLDYDEGSILNFNDGTMAAAHPLMVGGQFAGVLLLQADTEISPANNQETTIVGLILLTVGNTLALTLIAIPALIVAIPVGIIRARRLSGRLSQLADTADAMARGDLSQRVEVQGHDEVAQVSQRFNEMASKLDEADRARRAFVSNVSHELRTPVAIIQGNLEQLLNRASEETPTAEPDTLQAMHRETVTLNRLIDDLFTLARIEEAVLALQPTSTDVTETIRQAAGGIRTLAWERRKVSVETVLPKELPRAMVDSVRLVQVLNNLLYNALRHTPEGGLIVVLATDLGNEVEISVSDTGVGIPAEELERVFDRFHQVERTGRHHDGSGLGLAISRQLVEAMGGQISAESIPDQGTTFRFTLPVAR